ncbi:MAG: hypothetical protein ACR2PR_08835 [Pseudohongiellaceae bacterium]
MNEYTPEHLELWTRPDHYAGANWPDYYVFLGQHRDSDLLTQSNFACGLKAIGGEFEDKVLIVREGHWAVGWVEWIAIHKTASAALSEADEITAALADYPVVDESDWSEREWEAVHDYWGDQPSFNKLQDRLDIWQSYMRGREHWDPVRHNLPPVLAIRHPLHTLSERYPEFEQYVHDYVSV